MKLYFLCALILSFLGQFGILSVDNCESILLSLEGIRKSLEYYQENHTQIDFDGYSGFKILEGIYIFV